MSNWRERLTRIQTGILAAQGDPAALTIWRVFRAANRVRFGGKRPNTTPRLAGPWHKRG